MNELNKPNPKYDELADKLEILRGQTMSSQRKSKLQIIIDRCRKQQYHDFNSDFATPKMQMVEDLRAADLNIEAQEVINGNYDE